MQLGTLNKKILIEKPVVTTNANGESVKTWVTHTCAWANVKISAGNEQEITDRNTSVTGAIFTTHNIRATILPTMRVVYENKIFDIDSVTPIEQDRFIEIEANNFESK